MANNAKKTQVKKDVKKNLKEDNKSKTKEKVTKVVNEEVKNPPVVKEKKVNNSNKEEKVTRTLKKIDDNRKGIILFIVGFLLATLVFRCIFWPDRIATLKDGTQPVVNLGDKSITANDLYDDMKEFYSVKVLLNTIDDMILSEKYPDNDEMAKEIESTAEYYYSVYEKNYNYTKDKFLSEFGFGTEAQFLESLKLDYRRNKYYEEYVLNLVTDKEMQKYYEDEVFGDVDSKHILVSVDDEDGLSDEDAKKLANEIIGKLNNGASWDSVKEEYKDQIIAEDLGYNAFNASLDSAYLKECKDLEVGTYSKSPVLSSYGYHIVYKIDQKEKPSLDDVKDEVREAIAKNKKSEDTNLYSKALIQMREDAKLEFVDSKMKEEYKKYINE